MNKPFYSRRRLKKKGVYMFFNEELEIIMIPQSVAGLVTEHIKIMTSVNSLNKRNLRILIKYRLPKPKNNE